MAFNKKLLLEKDITKKPNITVRLILYSYFPQQFFVGLHLRETVLQPPQRKAYHGEHKQINYFGRKNNFEKFSKTGSIRLRGGLGCILYVA